MQTDFNKFRDHCPVVSTANYLLDCMLKKWAEDYEEPDLSEQWAASWSDQVLTRVQCNEFNPSKHGYPMDNNMIAVTNKGDKEYFTRQ